MADIGYLHLSCEEAARRIRGNEDTLVIAHARPDADALGSAFSMCLLLKALGCRAYCVCRDEIPERLEFLVGHLQESILPQNLPQDFLPTQIIAVDTASPQQMAQLFDVYGD